MAFCENCGSEVLKGQKFCENCGALLNETDACEKPYLETSSKSVNLGNHFCENCGAKLEPGTEFCESCGAKVSIEAVKTNKTKKIKNSVPDDWKDLFAKSNWDKLWYNAVQNAKAENCECGIILTNKRLLSETTIDNEDDVDKAIYNFIQVAEEKNSVKYYLLNIDKCGDRFLSRSSLPSAEEIKEVLKAIVDVAKPKYLFILGNEFIVANVAWENEYEGDYDYGTIDGGRNHLCSDLIYVTLDEISPFKGQKYNFDNGLRVGRLPSIPNAKFSSVLNNYTENMKVDIDYVNPFGVTALQWEDTSKHVYKRFADGCALNSPDLLLENFDNAVTGNENLLYFNVHGSSVNEYYYGADDYNLKEVVEPISFEDFYTPFILGVEACYGGATFDRERTKSTVFNAFYNKCVSMLASSYIAYGTPTGPGSNADILVGRYLQDMNEGYSAGDSYVNGLTELVGQEKVDYATMQKTMIEFVLYGDPSYRRSKNIIKKSFSLSKSFGGVSKGLKVPMPDVRRAISMSLAEVNSKISDSVTKHVMGKYKGFEGSSPIFYKYDNSKYTQASFKKSTEVGESYVKVYFDDNGKIVREIVSK